MSSSEHVSEFVSSPEHTSTTTPAFTISTVTVPESIDAPDAADFIGMATVRSIVEAELRGDAFPVADPEVAAAELLPNWKDQSTKSLGLIATVDGRVVGRGTLAMPGDASECWSAVSVLPEYRAAGIGSALYERLERMARDAGRRTIQNQTDFPAGLGGDSIPAPTGFGSVPARLASTRFLLRYGFTLEQVGRMSGLPLPMDADVAASSLDAAQAAATGYRTVTWEGPTPDEYVDAFALMRTRMTTDTPNAGMEQTEDVWTADRIRAFDAIWAESPMSMLTTIAVETATGRPAGYTELGVPAEPDRPAEQMDTLVLADHRGHRLGMLLKLINLRELSARFPDSRIVETMNAEDNRPMLDVNEAIGFVPLSYAARWKKRIG